jgi:hypothetical protein
MPSGSITTAPDLTLHRLRLSSHINESGPSTNRRSSMVPLGIEESSTAGKVWEFRGCSGEASPSAVRLGRPQATPRTLLIHRPSLPKRRRHPVRQHRPRYPSRPNATPAEPHQQYSLRWTADEHRDLGVRLRVGRCRESRPSTVEHFRSHPNPFRGVIAHEVVEAQFRATAEPPKQSSQKRWCPEQRSQSASRQRTLPDGRAAMTGFQSESSGRLPQALCISFVVTSSKVKTISSRARLSNGRISSCDPEATRNRTTTFSR